MSYGEAVPPRVVGFEYPAKATTAPRRATLGTPSSSIRVDPAVHSAIAIFSIGLRTVALIVIVNGYKRSGFLAFDRRSTARRRGTRRRRRWFRRRRLKRGDRTPGRTVQRRSSVCVVTLDVGRRDTLLRSCHSHRGRRHRVRLPHFPGNHHVSVCDKIVGTVNFGLTCSV